MSNAKLKSLTFPIPGTIKRSREDVTLLGITKVANIVCYRVKDGKREVTYAVDAVIARPS